MSDNFQKTVNLKKQQSKEQEEVPENRPVRKKIKKRAEEIDQVYNDHEEEPQDFKKITRPVVRQVNEPVFKRGLWFLSAIVLMVVVYFMFFKGNAPVSTVVEEDNSGWYAVELLNNEVYYGQIEDKTADPVVIKNVYYNYDQLNKDEEGEQEESKNLRLVKRGKEAHGPDGTMNIVRAQVVYMEPLKEDSKVLKAILDYEN